MRGKNEFIGKVLETFKKRKMIGIRPFFITFLASPMLLAYRYMQNVHGLINFIKGCGKANFKYN